MSDELQVCAWPEYDELSAMLAVVDAIPDGIRLAEYPGDPRGCLMLVSSLCLPCSRRDRSTTQKPG